MKVIDDFLSYREFECCHNCELKFARTNRENWVGGWRPDKDSEVWKDYMTTRAQLFRPVFKFA